MFRCNKNKFWLENPINLLCNSDLLPLKNVMNLSEQLNCLTRLVLLIFFILLLINFKYSFFFLLISLAFIIIIYYLQRKQMRRENYQNERNFTINTRKKLHQFPRPKDWSLIGQQTCIQCVEPVNLDELPGYSEKDSGVFNNPEYISINQKLAGPPNPKTLIAPVVIPPSSDLSYWRANNLVNHSAVNAESQIDVYQSGYQVSTCCPSDLTGKGFADVPNPLTYGVPIQNEVANYPVLANNNRTLQTEKFKQITSHQNDKSPKNENNFPEVIENYEFPYLKTGPEIPDPLVFPNASGLVNTNCGYNPDQLFSAGLPTNLSVGNCERDPSMKEYNENTFTQIIQPGVYTTNQINEPINSNIGISFQQQFPPTTVETNPDTGNILFTEHDPRILEPALVEPNLGVETIATNANIYDPRFSGYGTSYRSYTDDLTGQTRFFYDDINSIRMPNYLVRSNIDHQPFADQYGPIQVGNEDGNKFNGDIRTLANNAFLQGSLQFRTELQERLMRKSNARAWQQKRFPIRTNNAAPAMSGGGGAGSNRC